MREMNGSVSFNNGVLHNDITAMLTALRVYLGNDIPGISNSSFQMHSGTSPDATKNDMRKTTNRKWR